MDYVVDICSYFLSLLIIWNGSVISYPTCGNKNFHTWSTLYSHSSEAQQFQQVCHVPPCAHAWVIHDPFSYVYFPCVYSFFGEAPAQIFAMVIIIIF